MKMITLEDIKKIGLWISNKGRKLEEYRWKYHFGKGAKDDILKELKKYQNDDGGFGKGLNPDCLTNASSPLVTAMACKILYEIGCTESNDIIEAALQYFEKNHFDENTCTWSTVIKENNNAPHGTWWHFDEYGNNTWGFNPSMDIAAFMLYWTKRNSKGFKMASKSFKKGLKRLYSVHQMDINELNCYINALTIAKSRQEKFDFDLIAMEKKIAKLASLAIYSDSSKWISDFMPQPLDLIDSINGDNIILYPYLNSKLHENASLFIDDFHTNGLRDIPWTWGVNYSEYFEASKNQWKGILILEKALKCKRLGYIEPYCNTKIA